MVKKATMANLPVEIITFILLRLPIKTLCGLKCVCKSWRILISTPHFTKSHQKQSTNTHDGDAQLLIRTESLFTVSTNELLLKPPPLTKLDPLRNRNPNCFMDVSGSSGGLLCLLQYPETFFLLNPTTRESITMRPDPDYPVKLYGFGYVSLADDYKVIKIAASSMVRVYSTKTNSWKRVQCDFPYSFDAYSGKKPACVDGVVHWLVSDPNTFLRTAIVGFDFNEEKFKEIPLPDKGPCCKFGTTVYSEEEPCCAFGVIVYEKSLVSPCGYFWLDESRAARLEE